MSLLIAACVDSVSHAIDFCRRRFCQGSSVVEQGTHKPLVGSSNLPPGIARLWRCGISDCELNKLLAEASSNE
jgi:hypothetical protein